MSAGRRLNKTGIRCALAALAVIGGLIEMRSAEALEWEPVTGAQQTISEPPPIKQDTQPGTPLTWSSVDSSDATTQERQGLNWTAVSETDPTEAKPIKSVVVWEPIQPGEVITADELELEEDPDEVLVTVEPSGTTFANDKAIWRDDEWHPQISGTVPVGFGPKGGMFSASVWGIDCVTGAGFCANPTDFNDYLDQIESSGESQFNLSLGFGDAEKLVGVTVTTRIEETKIPFGERNTQNLETDKNLLDEYYIGVHVSRNLGPDTAIKFGIDNWIDVKKCGDLCGFPKSAYGVISQRIRLNEDQDAFFPNAYLTAGAGNGQFRPFGEMVRDSIAKQRAAGCSTFGYTADETCNSDTLYRAIQRASGYGKIYPIGSVALETFSGINIIGEWSGRNLNAGFSIRPFRDLGLILTGMWENILPNCDYGCIISIPDLPGGLDLSRFNAAMTERARFSFQASLELKF